MKRFIFITVFIFIAIFTISCDSKQYKILFLEEHINVTINDVFDLEILTNIENPDEIIFSFNEYDLVEQVNGSFKAINIGSLFIKAYWKEDPKVYTTISVTINDIKRSISFKDVSLKLFKGEIVDLECILENLTLADLGYRLSNSNTVSITNDWKIEPKEIGVVTLTLFYLYNDNINADLAINVEIKKSITFNNDALTIEIGNNVEVPISAVGINQNEIVYSYDVLDIIKVENNTIVPLKSGEVSLKATYLLDNTVFDILNIIVKEPKPVYTTNDYEYWLGTLQSKYNPYETILSREEIDNYNSTILSNYSLTKVLDILSQPSTITKANLETLINNYSNMNTYSVYDNGRQISSAEKSQILANRNLNTIAATTNVKYGIVTDFGSLRSYPTKFYSSTQAIDRFQETALNVGEGVLIYHLSSDGLWSFIQAQNYNGWIETKNIAICSYEEMNSFLNSNDFIIVTADQLLINDVYVRMGQRIPYLSKTNSNYILNFPTRDQSGNLIFKDISLDLSLDVSDGYLNYTTENVLKQGFKMLGIPYRWGDYIVDGRDCSSTQNAIYACFGFKMPRNTSNQNKIPTYSKQGGITINQLQEEYRPGSLIFSSGHVLMYIGEDVNGNSYVLHNTNAAVAGCKVQSVSSYGINNIIATLKLYK